MTGVVTDEARSQAAHRRWLLDDKENLSAVFLLKQTEASGDESPSSMVEAIRILECVCRKQEARIQKLEKAIK